MFVTATEFKSNIGKYLKLAAKEDIIITKNGKRIAKLTDAASDRTDIVRSLIGILPDNISDKDIKEARLAKYDDID